MRRPHSFQRASAAGALLSAESVVSDADAAATSLAAHFSHGPDTYRPADSRSLATGRTCSAEDMPPLCANCFAATTANLRIKMSTK